MTSTPIANDNILLDMKISDAVVGIYATNKRTRNILFNTSFLILHGHRIQSDLLIQFFVYSSTKTGHRISLCMIAQKK